MVVSDVARRLARLAQVLSADSIQRAQTFIHSYKPNMFTYQNKLVCSTQSINAYKDTFLYLLVQTTASKALRQQQKHITTTSIRKPSITGCKEHI